MLWLEDVHVRRGGTHALRGIDLEVHRGEIVALIGANGAGKTTTLSAISGLLRCQQGRIDFAPSGSWPPASLTVPKAGRSLAICLSPRT
jgi:branched-chain amino acid transport system ATP-binding protein